jgi:hypothetical protein
MISKFVSKAVLVATTVSVLATSAPLAVAQDYGSPPPPPQGYDQPPPGDNGPPPGSDNGGPPPPGYDNSQPPPGYDDSQPPPPPPGYDGSAPPPPPPGYSADESPQQQAQDQRYARYAQRWEQENCVQSHGNVAAGAIIGGVLGAVIGSAVGGRGNHGAGAFAGAAIGGTSGAVIASSSRGNETSPGCPPGYVVRDGAPDFYYAGYGGPYLYAAPGWYRPWVLYGDQWVFRPYPYHGFYYRHYYHGGRRYR